MDRHSIYKTTREASVDEKLAEEAPLTQFGRAMGELEVDLILAHSPQAKGRVERSNRVLQGRLVKALRLKGISNLAQANVFLEGEFLGEHNARFMVSAHEEADVHRSLDEWVKLDLILSFKETRTLKPDWTFSWRNRWFQLIQSDHSAALVGAKIDVIEELNGTIHLFYRDRELVWQELPVRPARQVPEPSQPKPKASSKPAPNHPWRRPALADRSPASASALSTQESGSPVPA